MMSLENPEALIWSNSSIAPAEGRKPLSIMTDPDFEAMVNPSLVPRLSPSPSLYAHDLYLRMFKRQRGRAWAAFDHVWTLMTRSVSTVYLYRIAMPCAYFLITVYTILWCIFNPDCTLGMWWASCLELNALKMATHSWALRNYCRSEQTLAV